MTTATARRDFRRMIKWIALVAVLMVIGALAYLSSVDGFTIHAIVATFLGVFISVIVGCGLMALAFFSNKSGHDDEVAGVAASSQNFRPEVHGEAAARLGSQQDGADPIDLEDRRSEIANPGSHGGGGDAAWRPTTRGH